MEKVRIESEKIGNKVLEVFERLTIIKRSIQWMDEAEVLLERDDDISIILLKGLIKDVMIRYPDDYDYSLVTFDVDKKEIVASTTVKTKIKTAVRDIMDSLEMRIFFLHTKNKQLLAGEEETGDYGSVLNINVDEVVVNQTSQEESEKIVEEAKAFLSVDDTNIKKERVKL